MVDESSEGGDLAGYPWWHYDRLYIQQVAIIIVVVCKGWLPSVEKTEVDPLLKRPLQYLIKLSLHHNKVER